MDFKNFAIVTSFAAAGAINGAVIPYTESRQVKMGTTLIGLGVGIGCGLLFNQFVSPILQDHEDANTPGISQQQPQPQPQPQQQQPQGNMQIVRGDDEEFAA